MGISTAVDASAVARVLGIKTTFKNLRQGITFLPQRIALVGQGNTASTYDTTKKQVTSALEVAQTYGFGSPLHLAEPGAPAALYRGDPAGPGPRGGPHGGAASAPVHLRPGDPVPPLRARPGSPVGCRSTQRGRARRAPRARALDGGSHARPAAGATGSVALPIC